MGFECSAEFAVGKTVTTNEVRCETTFLIIEMKMTLLQEKVR